MKTIVCAVLALAALPGSFTLYGAEEAQTAEQLYKNIQILKGIPATEVPPAMNFISGALGVRCGFCHTPDGPWPQGFDKDTIKAKQTAREMMKMTKQINDTSFGGRAVVTCASCHGGHTHPQSFVSIQSPEALREQLAHPAQSQTATLPGAEDLFAKYETAIGGDAAIAKLTSRHVIASIGAAGQAIKVESFAKSGDLMLEETRLGSNVAKNGFDGTHGYAVVGGKVTLATGADADSLKLGALFYRNLRLKDLYTEAHTLHKEKLDGKDVYVVQASLKIERFTDLLSFDADSGLLLRRTTLNRSVLGPIPQTFDFENYREINGVKIAMDTTRSFAGAPAQKMHLDEVRFNEPMDDVKFAMPTASDK